MKTPRPITIIGGGLAGLALGIGLQRRSVPVVVVEAGHYPRHRVCGEFISGRGLETLRRLGLRDLFGHSGGVAAVTAAFFSADSGTAIKPLPAQALCLSRYVMDEMLAGEFRRLGGGLREGERIRENDFGEGIVRATGRRSHPVENGWRWFGLKVHARNVELSADLEMHLSPAGYVGLCRLTGGEVNVCGLFRRRAGAGDAAPGGLGLLRGQTGTPLNRRLASASFDGQSFCSVAGLSVRPQRALSHGECCIGDAITMIPPVTGNGMSMAFESAEMAIEPLAAWSRGEIPWENARQEIARQCDAAFERRLAWAKWLQRAMLTPALHRLLIPLVSRSEWCWRIVFEKTR